MRIRFMGKNIGSLANLLKTQQIVKIACNCWFFGGIIKLRKEKLVMEKFIVKFAETEQEKMQTYKLRYNELILEYRPDNVNDVCYDVNEYDEHAKLAICIDTDTNQVVGSYRIITSDLLPKDKRFVSEEEFDISSLKNSGESIAELSRAVVKKEYRGSLVLMFLLRFVIGYIRENNYRFIIGEASFFGTDKMALQKEISYIAHNHFSPDYEIKSLDKDQIELLNVGEYDAREVRRSLPPLIRAYVSFGAFLSKETFCDYAFGSIDTFVLLDTKNCNDRYIDKFVGKA